MSESPTVSQNGPIDSQPQATFSPDVKGGHENNIIRLATVVKLTIGSILIVAIVQGVLLGGLRGVKEQQKKEIRTARFPGSAPMTPGDFPEPRLEIGPIEEMNKVRAEERALVENYAWVDRKAGIARIPVDRAMEILAERGLPKVAAPAPVAGAPANTFVPVAGKRDMAAPAISTGESPAKVGAPAASGTKPAAESKPAAKSSGTSESPKKEAKP